MAIFLQQLINGVTLGSIYGLIANGYTMVFGIIGMVNFAHGDVFMLSTFIALIIYLAMTQIAGITSLALSFVVVLFAAMALTALWAYMIERLAYRRLAFEKTKGQMVTIKTPRKMALFALILFIGNPEMISAEDFNHLPVSAPIDSDSAGRGGIVAVQSVLRIICTQSNSSGTGFLHKSGNLITAAHVVSGCSQPIILQPNGTQIVGSVKAQDDDLDLALIEPATKIDAPALAISMKSDLQIGTQVTTWGYPGGYFGRAPMLSVGYLSGLDARKHDSGKIVSQWVVNAAFNSGNSGGPLLQLESGEVIGVVSSSPSD